FFSNLFKPFVRLYSSFFALFGVYDTIKLSLSVVLILQIELSSFKLSDKISYIKTNSSFS
ncbi:hypothetical protein, partial [Aliarcobacter butzleri]|uniref:hypothetical protein n=1 Tax=Aliarcobacter butzleri TaxID=28197 RepID=UPI002B24FD6C